MLFAQLDDFPTVGCSFGPSRCFNNFYVGASRFLVDAPGILKEGYEKVYLFLIHLGLQMTHNASMVIDRSRSQLCCAGR